ncbi:MAG: hypothetical protein KBD48_03875 [Candidatus Pacebacteria bacterium]|nr:hypothetical protein [Candidatus Paceibacterota bacterium]MBP9716292.1 hypothetical protein [Candidatus Paceibacterota bacterium]
MNTEKGSEKDANENQLPQDKQGEGTQQVNGSKDTKVEKPFVEKKSMPGDEFLSKTE